MPCYVLSMRKDSDRMQKLSDLYATHFGRTKEDFGDLWSPVLKYTEFTTEKDAERTLKPEWTDLVDEHTSIYLAWAEISHYLSFSRVCYDIVVNNYDRAMFLEDDFNLIPMLDSKVVDRDGKVMAWKDVPENVDEAREPFDTDKTTFETRMQAALQENEAYVRAGNDAPDVLFLGSCFGRKRRGTVGKIWNRHGASIDRKPECIVATHAQIISNSGARRWLETAFPAKYRTDSQLHGSLLTKHEVIPNIIGQEVFFEVFKPSTQKRSTIDNGNYKCLKVAYNNKLCLANQQNVERVASIKYNTLRKIIAKQTSPQNTRKQSRRSTKAKNGFSEDQVMIKEDSNGKKYVEKVFKTKRSYQHELSFLKTLNGINHFPVIYSADDSTRTIEMSHNGDPITQETCPPNWKDQFLEILSTLQTKKNIPQ